MKVQSIRRKPARIEMLPLIDVVFLLLVVFIYAMLSMAVHKGMPVDLPDSSQARPAKQAPVSVTVTAAGDIFIDQQRVTMDTLTAALVQRSSDGLAPEGVMLFADQQVSYQQLFTVLDRIRQAGLEHISLQAETPAMSGNGP